MTTPAPHPLTLLAFDFGQRRIGVALGQTPGPLSRALVTLKCRNGRPDWSAIAQLIDEWRPQRLVVGLPGNMDDTPSPMTEQARRFGAHLEQRFGLPVEFADERLSSAAARTALGEQRRRGRRRRLQRSDVDREAARLIVEQWLAANWRSGD